MTEDNYPLCRSVQATLTKYHDHDPADYTGDLGLVLQAYDCSSGCIDEAVWSLEDLCQSIADKFRIALIGILTARGYEESTFRIIVEPEYDGCSEYAAFIVGTDEVILRDSCKAWHFGHDAGTLDDLEAFFRDIAEQLPNEPLQDYLQSKGIHCPICGSHHIDGRSFDLDEDGAEQTCSCCDCDSTWTDEFRLTGCRVTECSDEHNSKADRINGGTDWRD